MLRARAEQFYTLEVAGMYRQAEAYIAQDTKDFYYDHDKPVWKNFRIDKVEFQDESHAKLTVTVSQVLKAPGFGTQEFKVPTTQTWKLEDGEWFYYYDQTAAVDTPFGKWQVVKGDGNISLPPGMPADTSSIQSLISIDRTTIQLVAGSQKVETVTVSNHLPGSVSISIGADRPKGLIVNIDKPQLGRDEKAVISFSVVGEAKPTGTVRIEAGPLQEFLIQISTK